MKSKAELPGSDHSPQQKKDSISHMAASEAAVALLPFMVELLLHLISISSSAAAVWTDSAASGIEAFERDAGLRA